MLLRECATLASGSSCTCCSLRCHDASCSLACAARPDAGFGLGVKVPVDRAASGRFGSPRMYGWGGAATTTFWIDPVEEVFGIFITQFMPFGHYPITTEFQRTVYQTLVYLGNGKKLLHRRIGWRSVFLRRHF